MADQPPLDDLTGIDFDQVEPMAMDCSSSALDATSNPVAAVSEAVSEPGPALNPNDSQSPNGHGHSLEEAPADEFGLPISLLTPDAAPSVNLSTSTPTNPASTTAPTTSAAATSIAAPPQPLPPTAKSKSDKDGPSPAWSELKTKAGKERKRLPLACIACRRKKIRCSGEKPACKHCLRSRIPCVYKVTTRKAAPRTDYMAMLDKRLKRMEERIIKAVPKSDDPVAPAAGAAPAITRAIVKPTMPGAAAAAGAATGAKSADGAHASTAANKKRAAVEAFGSDLDKWARAPATTQADAAVPRPSGISAESEDDRLFMEGLDALPPRDIQEHLAEIFFDHVYGQAYYLLHKPSYIRKLKSNSLPPVLVLSVCAIAARFSTHPKLGSSPKFLRGEEWALVARNIVIKRYEWPNITILICLLLLGLHEFGTCHGGRSWALGGQAMRMAYALQLHRDLAHDPQGNKPRLSFIDREIRRRTMWACFLMDRLNSSGTDRPMFILEESVKIPLPIKETYFQLDVPAPTETLRGDVPSPVAVGDSGDAMDVSENMGVAAHTVRVIALWGRIITYVNFGGKARDIHPIFSPDSGYASLSKQAEDLLARLPPSLVYSRENLQLHRSENMDNQFLFMHIAIQQNILFLSRILLGKPPSPEVAAQTPRSFVTRVGEKAFDAAHRISELLHDAETHFVTAPFAGYCAFSSSTIHIIGIFSGKPSLETACKRDLATNVRYLSKMKRYWGMFHWMSENLREQYRTYADAAACGHLDTESASPIFQYGDWFDQYPHGVFNGEFTSAGAGSATTTAAAAADSAKQKSSDAAMEQKPELHTVEEFFTTITPPQGAAAAAAATAATAAVEALGLPPAKRKAGARKTSVVEAERTVQIRSTPTAATFQQQQQQPAVGFDTQIQQQQQQQQQQQHTGFPPPPPLQTTASAPMNPSPLHTTTTAFMPPLSPQPVTNPPTPFNPVASFFPPDLFSMSFSQSASIVQPLDRQLVLSAYAMELGMGHPNNLLDPGAAAAAAAAAAATATAASAAPGAQWPPDMHDAATARHRALMRPPAMTGPQARARAPAPAPGLNFGPEASSAWFMPFNVEPPEISSHDVSIGMGGLESFGGIFAGGIPGMEGMDVMDGMDGV